MSTHAPANLIWTQIAASRTFRAYDSGDYRVVVGTGNDWTLSYRNTSLGGIFNSFPDAHVAAVAHRSQVQAAAA